jgi:hypothetical protein
LNSTTLWALKAFDLDISHANETDLGELFWAESGKVGEYPNDCHLLLNSLFRNNRFSESVKGISGWVGRDALKVFSVFFRRRSKLV